MRRKKICRVCHKKREPYSHGLCSSCYPLLKRMLGGVVREIDVRIAAWASRRARKGVE